MLRLIVDGLFVVTSLVATLFAWAMFQVSTPHGFGVTAIYSFGWAVFVILARFSQSKSELKWRIAEAARRGKEYHRLSKEIVLLAITPFVIVILAIGIWYAQIL